MTFLAVSPESRAQSSDDVRAGARDFGDITSLTGPRFPRGTLDGDGDQVDYYQFTLTEAKRIGLGLRQQDADADMFLEDSDGNELYGSTASGTDNEVIAGTLIAGTYYVRVESQEAGTNAYVFRYGVSAPDPDALAALQEEQGTPETVSEPDGEDLSDDTRAGATDFGDITLLTGPRFPRGTLDGDGNQVNYYRFTLTEAKRVDLGLRQQDVDADMFLEDAAGNELYGSTASGTDNEVIAGTLLAGTYYVRVESQEAGTNAYVFRYGVSAPDPPTRLPPCGSSRAPLRLSWTPTLKKLPGIRPRTTRAGSRTPLRPSLSPKEMISPRIRPPTDGLWSAPLPRARSGVSTTATGSGSSLWRGRPIRLTFCAKGEKTASLSTPICGASTMPGAALLRIRQSTTVVWDSTAA